MSVASKKLSSSATQPTFVPTNRPSPQDAELELGLLESKVSENMYSLNRMKEALMLKSADSPDARQWLQQINHLQSQVTRTEIILGVVGSTGAGKSSMINAVLDEERLLSVGHSTPRLHYI